MSEVKRYYVNLDHGTRYSPVDGCDQAMNKAEDFDRVTAERDAALADLSALATSFDQLAECVGFSKARLDQTGDSPFDCANQLQQRLTAAELKVSEYDYAYDEKCKRLTAADERADMLEGLLREAMPALDLAASAFKSAMPVRSKVRAALKLVEGGGDE